MVIGTQILLRQGLGDPADVNADLCLGPFEVHRRAAQQQVQGSSALAAMVRRLPGVVVELPRPWTTPR